LALKTVDGISRPAITTMLPSGNGDTRVVGLDLGANVQCDEEILFDFSILGSVYAEIIGNMERPRVGILNIGEEETKGSETLQRLNKILIEHKEELPYEYIGFVEGNDVTAGNVQVVVTDGFTGNVMLKTVEGTAKMISRIVKANYKRSFLAILGTFFLIHLFKRLKNKIDPRSYAGAVFLGLNGFSIKTHGNSDALSWTHALEYAVNLSKSDFYGKIRERTNSLSNIKQEIKNTESAD
jgi:glycerol-3-phosphate acyltransferase PlsX